MKPETTHPSLSTRWIPTALGTYAIAGGFLSFVGWAADIRRLTDWNNDGISIQPNASLAAMVAGAAVVCLVRSYRRSAAVLGVVVLLLGSSALFQNITGIDLGIDTLLLFDRQWGSLGTLSLGRMGLPGSTSWMLLGLGVILTLQGPRARQSAVILALLAAVLSTLSLVGYLFNADPLYSLPRFTSIAFQTSTMIMAVASGIVVALPEQQPMRTLAEASAAGLLVRRALPVILLVPIFLGLLRLKGQTAGWYDTGMGVAILVLALIAVMAAGLWWAAAGLRRHEVALKQAEDQLRQAARMEALGRLAGGLAHDFNNQLQAVAGLAAFVSKDSNVRGRSREDVEEIQKSVERIASLIRQLLAFSRKQVLIPEAVELNASILDSVPLLRQFLGPTITLRVEPCADPVWVRVDRAQLHQVLVNLTINARDAMPSGGGLVLTATQEKVSDLKPRSGVKSGVYGCLTVTDTGDGIDPNDLPFIFEPFFTTKAVGAGTGLGLATVHGIISQSQGHIQVQSGKGQGTRFSVLLPVTSQPLPVSVPPPLAREPGLHRARILVVEDELLIRGIMQRTLEGEGYRVFVAQDGRDALACLEREGSMDLVLSDVVMPNMGGAELGEVLATRYPDLPVVWMSGYPKDIAFREGNGRDHQPFLQKPLKIEHLLEVVGAEMSRRNRLDGGITR